MLFRVVCKKKHKLTPINLPSPLSAEDGGWGAVQGGAVKPVDTKRTDSRALEPRLGPPLEATKYMEMGAGFGVEITPR